MVRVPVLARSSGWLVRSEVSLHGVGRGFLLARSVLISCRDRGSGNRWWSLWRCRELSVWSRWLGGCSHSVPPPQFLGSWGCSRAGVGNAPSIRATILWALTRRQPQGSRPTSASSAGSDPNLSSIPITQGRLRVSQGGPWDEALALFCLWANFPSLSFPRKQSLWRCWE